MKVLRGMLVWSAATLISMNVMAGGKTDLPTLTIGGNTFASTKVSVDVLIEASDETGREFCQDTFHRYHGNSVYPHRYWLSDVSADLSDSWGNYKTEKVTLNEMAFNTLEKKVADGSLVLPIHFDTMKYFERCGFTVKRVIVRDEKGSMFSIKDADYNDRPNTFVAVRAGNSDGLFNLDYRWYDLDFTVDFK
jgi:hypothetical protein